MNIFSVFSRTIHSQSDFDSIFTVVGGTDKKSVTLQMNTESSVKERLYLNGLDSQLGDILFNPRTKTTFQIDAESRHIIILVEFPSYLYFKGKESDEMSSLTIEGNLSRFD